MTFTHDDIQQHLIEFLYGELDAGVRAAFDAHIGACERCRLEVNALRQTRATARAVVRAPLDQPVPPAVRARVMEAATRAATERELAGRTSDHAAARPAPSPVGRATPRWLAWLRARWTLPMLTTVAAMGALLLFRETIFREARRPLGDTSAEELLPKPAPAPSAGAERLAEPVKAKSEDRNVGDNGADKSADNMASQPAKQPASNKVASFPRRRAPAPRAVRGGPPAGPAKKDGFGSGAGALGRSASKGSVDDLLQKAEGGRAARPAAAQDEQPKSRRRDLGDLREGAVSGSGDRAAERQPSYPREESRSPAKSAPVAADADLDEGRFAEPPPPAARKPAAPPAPPPAPAPPAPAPRAPVLDSAADATPRVLAEKKSKKGKKSEESESAVSETRSAAPESAAREQAASASTGAASRPAADPAAVLVDRAEKLMAARRFAQAAVVYRDLLQRFPQHAAAPTWRRRLAAAQAAAAQDAQNQKPPGDSGFATPPPPR